MDIFVWFLGRLLLICAPLCTFMFILWYKKEHEQEYDASQIDVIENYLVDYFSVCDEPLVFSFSINHYVIQPSVIPVKGMEDIEVLKNDYDAGNLVSYFLDEKEDAFLLYHSLCKKRQLKKRKQIPTIILLKKLEKRNRIHNEIIKELVFQLQNAFSLLYQQKKITQHLQNYLLIVNDILERYQKLEDAGAMKEETREKTIHVLQETAIRIKKEAFD